MVDVARHVPARRAVDRVLAVELEHIARTARLAAVGLVVGQARTAIPGDVGAALDGLDGKQPEPGLGTGDAEERQGHHVRLAVPGRFVIPLGRYPHLWSPESPVPGPHGPLPGAACPGIALSIRHARVR